MTQNIHQEVRLPGAPARVYGALTDAVQFSKMSGGAPAEIDPKPGGAFAMFGGMIEGRNVECAPGQRLVSDLGPQGRRAALDQRRPRAGAAAFGRPGGRSSQER